MSDRYRSLVAPTFAEPPKVKGSRFFGEAAPAPDAAAALAFVDSIRRREPGATHWCWAYRLGAAGEEYRYSDDGEPSGSAGAPILRQIEGRDLTHVVVVVTRYYGGTKLGTGGLVRAYGEAAAEALAAGEVVEVVRQARLRLGFAYDDTAAAQQTLHRFGATVLEQVYNAETALTVAVPYSEAGALAEAFTEALGGRGEVKRLD